MILLISTLVGTVIKEQIGKVAKSFMIISLILVSVIYFILIYKTYKNNIRVEYTLSLIYTIYLLGFAIPFLLGSRISNIFWNK